LGQISSRARDFWIIRCHIKGILPYVENLNMSD
jgi:hypothetical protein